jgi:hypothetical protein
MLTAFSMDLKKLMKAGSADHEQVKFDKIEYLIYGMSKYLFLNSHSQLTRLFRNFMLLTIRNDETFHLSFFTC